MKDPTTIQLLITSLTGLATIVLTIMLPFILKRMEAKQAAKIEEYRKEVNGHMTQLIESKIESAGAKATLAEKEKGELKAAEIKATVAISPTAIPPINIEKVVVQTKTISAEEAKEESKTEDKK